MRPSILFFAVSAFTLVRSMHISCISCMARCDEGTSCRRLSENFKSWKPPLREMNFNVQPSFYAEYVNSNRLDFASGLHFPSGHWPVAGKQFVAWLRRTESPKIVLVEALLEKAPKLERWARRHLTACRPCQLVVLEIDNISGKLSPPLRSVATYSHHKQLPVCMVNNSFFISKHHACCFGGLWQSKRLLSVAIIYFQHCFLHLLPAAKFVITRFMMSIGITDELIIAFHWKSNDGNSCFMVAFATNSLAMSVLFEEVKAAMSITTMSNTWPGSRAVCGPVEGFVRASFGFHCNKSNYILTICAYFDILINFNLTFLMQAVLSAILSCLLPLQLWFERFQCISSSEV